MTSAVCWEAQQADQERLPQTRGLTYMSPDVRRVDQSTLHREAPLRTRCVRGCPD